MYVVKIAKSCPWINQSSKNEELMTTTTTNKFENHLLSIKAEHQKRIRPNLYPTYNLDINTFFILSPLIHHSRNQWYLHGINWKQTIHNYN